MILKHLINFINKRLKFDLVDFLETSKEVLINSYHYLW